MIRRAFLCVCYYRVFRVRTANRRSCDRGRRGFRPGTGRQLRRDGRHFLLWPGDLSSALIPIVVAESTTVLRVSACTAFAGKLSFILRVRSTQGRVIAPVCFPSFIVVLTIGGLRAVIIFVHNTTGSGRHQKGTIGHQNSVIPDRFTTLLYCCR